MARTIGIFLIRETNRKLVRTAKGPTRSSFIPGSIFQKRIATDNEIKNSGWNMYTPKLSWDNCVSKGEWLFSFILPMHKNAVMITMPVTMLHNEYTADMI